MIKAEKLQRHFSLKDVSVKAVDEISLSISPGEFVAIMGPSGSGKSTLLYMLGAMDKPTGGHLSINDQIVSKMDDESCSRFRSRELGFIFQSFHLLPKVNLIRNVELPMLYAGIEKEQRIKRSKLLLESVGLGDRMEHLPTELSGGQCQRAAIARSLANGPSLLLADEPTGNLDSRTGEEIIAIFQCLNRAGMTIAMVTHDNNMAMHAGRIIKMSDGKVVSDEQVAEKRVATISPESEKKLLDGLNEAY